jgi:integrase
LTTAVADELILRNPCVVRGAGVERTAERPVATAQQVWDVAERIGDRYRVLVLIAGFVGLRVGELLGLERRHVNLLHQTITVEQQEQQLAHGQLVLGPPKSDAGVRTLVLPTFLAKELEHHLERFTGPRPGDRVFPGEKGGPLRRHVLAKHWRATRQPVDLPPGFRFHDLCQTANTITASAGASTRELMHRMGHASPEAALRYQHATRDRDAALAAALGDLVQDAKSARRADSAR